MYVLDFRTADKEVIVCLLSKVISVECRFGAAEQVNITLGSVVKPVKLIN